MSYCVIPWEPYPVSTTYVSPMTDVPQFHDQNLKTQQERDSMALHTGSNRATRRWVHDINCTMQLTFHWTTR